MNLWYIIDPKKARIDSFEDKEEAIKFYNKNCVNGEKTNCWGLFIQRPKGFFDNLKLWEKRNEQSRL